MLQRKGIKTKPQAANDESRPGASLPYPIHSFGVRSPVLVAGADVRQAGTATADFRGLMRNY